MRLDRYPSARATGVAAAIVAGIALGGCSKSDESASGAAPAGATVASATRDAPARANGQTPATPQQGEGPPFIAFAKKTYDFGTMIETEKREGWLDFTNTGGEVLIIEEIKTTCGCTVAVPDKREYAPGETGRMHVKFEPTGPGAQNKVVSIFSNSVPAKRERLEVIANVEPFVFVEPAEAAFGERRYGEPQRMALAIGCVDEAFEIEKLHSTSDAFKMRVVPAAEREAPAPGAPRREIVEINVPVGTNWGGNYGIITVTVHGRPKEGAEPVSYARNLRAGIQLFGDLRADPDIFRFGVKPNESFERTITITGRGGRAFRVVRTEAQAPDIVDATARAEELAPDRWKITLAGRGRPTDGGALGHVIVETDVPGEERLAIPIVGSVQSRPVM